MYTPHDQCPHKFWRCVRCGLTEPPLSEEDKVRIIQRQNETIERLNAEVAILRAFRMTG